MAKKKKIRSIAIAGAGNMAFAMGTVLQQSFQITAVVTRNKTEGKKLSRITNATYFSDWDTSIDADAIMLCLSDYALKQYIKEHEWNDRLLIHCSGSTDINIFNHYAKRYGVIYPLQTLNKARQPDWNNIPLFVEADSAATMALISGISKKISPDIIKVSSEERLYIHLAAIFANNFTNACYTIAQSILHNKNLPDHLLDALITETANNAVKYGPIFSQTGPARRGDKITMQKHLKLLKSDKQVQQLYRSFSKLIAELYKPQRIY